MFVFWFHIGFIWFRVVDGLWHSGACFQLSPVSVLQG
jgi:hypothetical protein